MYSRAWLPCQNDRTIAVLSGDSCSAMKVGVQLAVPWAVLQNRVLVLQGAVCQGRDSASYQGQHSACLGRTPRCWRGKLCVEGAGPDRTGKGPTVGRVLHGLGMLRVPDYRQVISKEIFQGEVQFTVYIKWKESIFEISPLGCLGGQWELGIYFSTLDKTLRPQFYLGLL